VQDITHAGGNQFSKGLCKGNEQKTLQSIGAMKKLKNELDSHNLSVLLYIREKNDRVEKFSSGCHQQVDNTRT